MTTLNGLREIIAQLQRRGFSSEIATDYAVRLGDTIEEDNGKWIIRNDAGQIIDRIEPIV